MDGGSDELETAPSLPLSGNSLPATPPVPSELPIIAQRNGSEFDETTDRFVRHGPYRLYHLYMGDSRIYIVPGLKHLHIGGSVMKAMNLVHKHWPSIKYVYYLQHDFYFTKPIDHKALVGEMDRNDKINYIRFPKRHAGISKSCGDAQQVFYNRTTILENRTEQLVLYPTSDYSDNNHLVRLKWNMDVIASLIKLNRAPEDPLQSRANNGCRNVGRPDDIHGLVGESAGGVIHLIGCPLSRACPLRLVGLNMSDTDTAAVGYILLDSCQLVVDLNGCNLDTNSVYNVWHDVRLRSNSLNDPPPDDSFANDLVLIPDSDSIPSGLTNAYNVFPFSGNVDEIAVRRKKRKIDSENAPGGRKSDASLLIGLAMSLNRQADAYDESRPCLDEEVNLRSLRASRFQVMLFKSAPRNSIGGVAGNEGKSSNSRVAADHILPPNEQS
ncbi:hypothetical protein THAOC_05546, partial [Thalassiosira oceanica]